MTDKESLYVVADNLDKFWAALAVEIQDDEHRAALLKVLIEDANGLRAIAEKMDA